MTLADSSPVKTVVDRFLERQRQMYAGGELDPVEELLAEDIVWHVPGTSPIAGDYHGREAVLGYFRARRALAGGRIAVTKHDEMHDDEVLVQLADGSAPLGGREVVWRTAGVYRVADGKIAEAWLVPLELEAFDRAWAAARARPFVYMQRVRPQECAASTMLGHPRFLEFFEAAFIEWWRERVGPLAASLGTGRRLTVATVQVSYLAPVRADDELRIEVVADRITTRSLQIHYDAYVDDLPVAQARSHYVCIDAETGEPTGLPSGLSTAPESGR
jgi:acyl-CoA thioesterase FadM/ketosteroid isomerase-like protein